MVLSISQTGSVLSFVLVDANWMIGLVEFVFGFFMNDSSWSNALSNLMVETVLVR